MTIKVNIHQAKSNLSRLIQAAKDGEEVIIARAGMPEVRLVPVTETADKPRRRFGGEWAGKVWYAPDYDLADAEIERDFLEGKIFPDGDV